MQGVLWLIGLGVFFGPIVLATIALVRAAAARNALAELESRVATLEVSRTETETASPTDDKASTGLEGQDKGTEGRWEQTPANDTDLVPEPASAEHGPAVPAPEAPGQDDRSLPPREPPEGDSQERAAAPRPADDGEPSSRPRAVVAGAIGFERALTVRWMVWLGAIVLALAAVFLIRYSIEREWLTPAARCGLGALAGIAFAVLGEWLRRHPLDSGPGPIEPNHVPPALSAAGVITLYASSYAAFALYELLGPLGAFAALACVSFLAFALALTQGPFIAGLGVLGGFALPLLVSTGQGSAYALFPFLGVLSGVIAVVVHYRAWRHIAWLGLGGALLWPALWVNQMWAPGDTKIVGAYLLGLLILHLHVRPLTDREEDMLWEDGGVRHADALLWGCAGGVTWLIISLVLVEEYAPQAFVLPALLSGLLLYTAYREPRHDRISVLALVAVIFLFATYELPEFTDTLGGALGERGWLYDLGHGPFVPPLLVPYALLNTAFAGAFAAAGFWALWRTREPTLWAGLSVAGPLQLLIIAFVRITEFTPNLHWAVAAAIVAGLLARGALALARDRDRDRFANALAIYTLGAFAAATLAVAWTLEEAWLTVALALQVPAAAHVHHRLRLPTLELFAWIIAGVVLGRLLLNIEVFNYESEFTGSMGWTLYGYGVPALALWYAALRFAKHANIALVRFLEAGALALAVLTVTAQIRFWTAGSLDATYTFVEASIMTLAWLAMAYGLYLRTEAAPHVVLEWGWRVLGCFALGHLALVQCMNMNPLVHPVEVGAYPLVNLLLLAYGAPTVAGLAFFRTARRREGDEHRTVATASAVSMLALVFVQLTLEVRRAFHGPVLVSGLDTGGQHEAAATSDAEWYAYSVAWLAYAAVLLTLGIRRGSVALRYASLALVLATTGKLFLFDMAALTGLFRVASFLGLGLSLIAIGYVYQRFVFATGHPPATAD